MLTMSISGQILLLTSPLLLAFTLPVVQSQNNFYREGLPTVWNVTEYPNPHSVNQDQQRMCGRFNQSFVCDPNAEISTTQADAIDAEIIHVMANTPCHCAQCRGKTWDKGYKIRVAIIRKMERVRYTSPDRLAQLADAQLYAYILSQRWHMDGFCNETLLILYSKMDNLVYTLTMPVAKMRLSNNDVTSIIMMTRPYFENRETIADGIIQMIRRYSLVFNNRRNEALQPGEK